MKIKKHTPIILFLLFFLFIPLLGCGGNEKGAPQEPSPEHPSEGSDEPASTDQVESGDADDALNDFLLGNIAYNAPEKMKYDDTVTLELLLSSSKSQEELKEIINKVGIAESATVEITPRMKAVLRAENSEAFEIQSIHDSPEQIVGESQETRWAWIVKAKKAGEQNLILSIYRLVKYDERDYWREVESYKTKITVEITLGQRIKAWDWKWVILTIITAILIPAFWRWIDGRKKKEKA